MPCCYSLLKSVIQLWIWKVEEVQDRETSTYRQTDTHTQSSRSHVTESFDTCNFGFEQQNFKQESLDDVQFALGEEETLCE